MKYSVANFGSNKCFKMQKTCIRKLFCKSQNYVYLSCKTCMFLTLHIKYQRQKCVNRVAYFLGVLYPPIYFEKEIY